MRSAWDELLQDLRYALRGLRRAPSFTVTALLAIAVGTGAATAVFSVVDRILFRPLPYPNAGRLVSFGISAPIVDDGEFMLGADYYEWREEHSAFDGMTTWSMSRTCDLTSERPERLNCAPVEANFLKVLGIPPLAGRDFTRREDQPGAPKVAILTYGLWHSRFASDRGVIGRAIQLDGEPVTVVGVLPPDFEMPTLNRVDLLIPQALNPAGQQRPNTGAVLRAFARLKPGVTIAQAKAALAPYFTRSLTFVPAPFRKEVRLSMRSLRDRQTQNARLASWTLLGAVAAVLLIGCANVANLLLARGAARRHEFAVRMALGASRGRLLRQRLTESLLLGVIGGVAGCGIAYALLKAFVAIAPEGILRLEQARLDGRVLVFALVLALLSGALFGLVPALQRQSPEELTGARSTGVRRNLLGHAILAGQIAVSVVLLSAAALLLRSFWNVQSLSLGIRPAHVFTVPLAPGRHQYPRDTDLTRFFDKVERRAARLPGVDSFALSDSLPPAGQTHTMIYTLIDVEGRPRAPQGTGGMVVWRWVTPQFFHTLGIPILRGRGFDEHDRDPDANVVILGETLVRRLFPGQNPLGQHLQFGHSGPWYTVIGVAGAVKNGDVTSTASDPEYYFVRKHATDGTRRAFLTVRSRMAPEAFSKWIRQQIAEVDPALPVTVESMAERASALTARPRFNAMLLSVFAGCGLLLAAIGLYGVMTFLVAQRTQEIGVRMALGATRGSVMRLVMSHAARWTVAGCVVGLAVATQLGRLLKSLLFAAPSQDVISLVAACAVLGAVVFLASVVPARRAATVDPMQALRHE